MSWRIVVISKRAKLEYKMNYLVVRDTEMLRIHLSEIHTLIIESTAVSLTAMLVAQLQERKINIIFCDNHRNPLSNVLPLYGCHNATEKVKSQIAWKREIKDQVWTRIIYEKITNQANVLKQTRPDLAEKLTGYASSITAGDRTNREAHAAKVYFNALFGNEFSRHKDSPINAALNYGYTILLSAINREIVINGYLTQLGIFHDNAFNQFNLSSDLIEPLRSLIDKEVVSWGSFEEFTSNQKMRLVDVMNCQVNMADKRMQFVNALGIYCRSVLESLSEQNLDLIQCMEYE
ncbi:type II CRISPR-associated endonuclease Cas1 [Sphaerochaeta halotolerans]|jgi:CRISPR-associated endonuclease Cas1 subtype II|uniref:CRISPR-associated endonuclease Cas1 n=1 Tax=Sphaerochaeta halotolerans TaxID=2293840 RepID=A0A372MJP3_9SPIR|nr:type II CRISPR-associated endonuclease Cas1 [Sphaerochaeta halotolerans]MDN5333303.1 CRISP-associated protein Cas1 [Sphaerochaeta sp.]RFU95400.1 type II CRISPR-associated endonuclease Cas1 [Sphaerochaeta halotolerans]